MKKLLTLCVFLALSTCQPALAADTCFHDCRVDDTGYVLIKNYEGFSPFVYRDVRGVPTVGFGHALLAGETFKTPLTGPAALALLQRDVDARSAPLNAMIAQPLTVRQFDAVASLAYNVGLGRVQESSVMRLLNAGEHDQVPPRFLLYDKSGGVVYRGLRIRREAEAKLYEEGTIR